MRKRISAKATFLVKFVLPVAVILSYSMTALAIIFSGTDQNSTPWPLKIIFPALLLVVIAILYRTVMQYKAVSLDDDFLYVSNYLREFAIPASNVREITEITWLRGHPVTVHLKTASDFGRKITFMPRSQYIFRPHPIVAELKTWAAAHNREVAVKLPIL